MYYIFMIRAKLCIFFRGCPILFCSVPYNKGSEDVWNVLFRKSGYRSSVYNLFGAERMVIACGNMA